MAVFRNTPLRQCLRPFAGRRTSLAFIGLWKHKAQWKSSLAIYAMSLRDKPVDTITTDDVLAVLTPIGQAKAETASRVRGRIRCR